MFSVIWMVVRKGFFRPSFIYFFIHLSFWYLWYKYHILVGATVVLVLKVLNELCGKIYRLYFALSYHCIFFSFSSLLFFPSCPSLGLFLSFVHYYFPFSFFFFLIIFDLSKSWLIFNIDIQIFDMKIYPISFCITWIIYLPLCHYYQEGLTKPRYQRLVPLMYTPIHTV